MPAFRVLVATDRGYIKRIYSEGWDSNIAAWTEEVQENFSAICEWAEDSSDDCQIVGEAKWVWLRFSPNRTAYVREVEHAGAEKVTMIRVHRKRGSRKKEVQANGCKNPDMPSE